MNPISFDTLKFARTLRARGGFTAEQSASLVEADTLKWLAKGMIGFQTVAILGAALFLARMGH
jgi:hypothetical protein